MNLPIVTSTFLESSLALHQHIHCPIRESIPPYLTQYMPNMKSQNQQTIFAPSAIEKVSVDTADSEVFRYNVTLGTPTAICENKDNIPMTYLNKGEVYSLSITDSARPVFRSEPLQYRTFVYLSFHEQEQRAKPEYCWRIWKEGRGSREAHRHDGNLRAIEFLNSTRRDVTEFKNSNIQVEQTSFNGFCITWSPDPTISPFDCQISIRFHLLSTDFTHSKGVKGVPIRLCAKTQLLSSGNDSQISDEPELCYCQIQVFRDHGAERKLSNDIRRLEKVIEKMTKKMNQLTAQPRPKKCKRSNVGSLGSNSLNFGCSSPDSEDKNSEKALLQEKIQSSTTILSNYLSSNHPISVLSLRGYNDDDPDMVPIQIHVDSELERIESPQSKNTEAFSKFSFHTFRSKEFSTKSDDANQGRHKARLHGAESISDSLGINPIILDVDPCYRPPTTESSKSISCFYVWFAKADQTTKYYRAIYLKERLVQELVVKIAEKVQIDSDRVVRVLQATENERNLFDDETLDKLPDGHAMIVRLEESMISNGSQATIPLDLLLEY